MTITRINEFVAAEGKAEELFAFLKSLIPHISSSEGCELCEVLQSADDKNRFVVLEKWLSVESHTQSVANFPKEQMQAAMPLFGAPPKGCFYQG
ncbi:antibiotic biosynthesis monooxygenase [Shewanella sp. AS16]|uniref:putative quinol monooxygenase n=1 Tax=Shewanella sp. AS16 TaxID=2907625 RepID=UPI001F20C870|nr:antibiotic biosynthesis monooxygenase family protein [Shewanella sp. AS16]MCE9684808.1 antibiotic biosynthesis monooxygenase [Shewanella sp. AS16]